MIYWSIFNGKASKSSYRCKGYELWFIQRCKTFQTISIDFVVHVFHAIFPLKFYWSFIKFKTNITTYPKIEEHYLRRTKSFEIKCSFLQFYIEIFKKEYVLRRLTITSCILRILGSDSFLIYKAVKCTRVKRNRCN